MKWILCILLILSRAPAFAADQYSKAQCDDLKNQKEQIRKRMNAGYGVQEGNWLNKRDRELFRLIGLHCSSPNSTRHSGITASSNLAASSASAEVTSPTTSLSKMPDWSANNAVFRGEKAAAWSEYYQVPTKCRQRNLSETDFVQCAEHKATERQKFARAWDKLKFTPLTVGTTEATLSESGHPAHSESLTTATNEKTEPLTLLPAKASVSGNKDFHKHFTWFGIGFVMLVAGACWLIWRK